MKNFDAPVDLPHRFDRGDRRAHELARQQRFAEAILAGKPFIDRRETDVSALDWAAHEMEKRTDDSRTAEAA